MRNAVARAILAAGLFAGLTPPPAPAATPATGRPILSPIADQSLARNTALAVPFTVRDDHTPSAELRMRAQAANPALIPNAYLQIRGTGTHRTLHLRPQLDQTGATKVTLTVVDRDGHQSEAELVVRVNPSAYLEVNALMANVLIDETVPAITLVWNPLAGTDGYTIHRRDKDAPDWGPPIARGLTAATHSYIDTNVTVGVAYEYKISAGPRRAFHLPAYLSAGIRVAWPRTNKRLILLVDQSHTNRLARGLDRLTLDLEGDGWIVTRHDVSPSASVVAVKSLIRADWRRDPGAVTAVFLLGHVPIPYSGWCNPDSHHRRAFPADAFYGDMDGRWTDAMVSSVTCVPPVPGQRRKKYHECIRPETRNFPGDGRYDQSVLPSDIELQVGRVDFFNLPAFQPFNESDLLQRYLDKNHRFRLNRLSVARQGLVDGWISPYAQIGSALFGPDHVSAAPFLRAAGAASYLWGARAQFGNYHGFNDSGGSTRAFAAAPPQVVFLQLFGSYFCEWDYWDSFLRAPLAAPGYPLASMYGSRPLWPLHPLALGEHIGYCARRAQNQADRGYQVDVASRGVHIALMGDPTLRLHPVSPVSALTAQVTPGGVHLRWDEAPDAVEGYLVYRRASNQESFTRLTEARITATEFNDLQVPPGIYRYLVRAVKLELTPGGSYYNPSQGRQCQVTVATAPDRTPPTVELDLPPAGGAVSFPATLRARARDDREIARVDFLVDDRLVGTDTDPPYAVVWSESNVTSLTRRLSARAVDTAGQVTVAARTITVTARDTTPPALELREPRDGQTVWGHVLVRTAATDDTGIDRVELWVDGRRHQTQTTPPYDFVWHTIDVGQANQVKADTQTVPDGPHRLLVKAIDRAGNPMEKELSLTVDSALARPMILPVSPEEPRIEQGGIGTLTLHWNGGPMRHAWTVFLQLEDPQSGKRFTLDSHQPPVPTHYWSGAYQYPVMIKLNPAIPPGRYRLMAGLYRGGTRTELKPGPGVIAAAGRRYRIGALNIVPDRTPPEFIGSNLTNGARLNGIVDLTAEVRDLNGIARVSWQNQGRTIAVMERTNLVEREFGIQTGRFPWDTTALPSAPLDLALQLRDAAGNTTNTNFPVRITNPVILRAQPESAVVKKNQAWRLTYRWRGGPLSFPANVITVFFDARDNSPRFSVPHTPNPPMTAWTGKELTESQSIVIPPNIAPGPYRIALLATRAGGRNQGAIIPLRPGPGVQIIRLAGQQFYQVGTVTFRD